MSSEVQQIHADAVEAMNTAKSDYKELGKFIHAKDESSKSYINLGNSMEKAFLLLVDFAEKVSPFDIEKLGLKEGDTLVMHARNSGDANKMGRAFMEVIHAAGFKNILLVCLPLEADLKQLDDESKKKIIKALSIDEDKAI